MSVPSLAGLCRKTIFANIDELSYVSTLPYEKCREILKHVKTAQQLAVIEDYSPQIRGEDSELWEAFIRRDFPVPMKRKNYEPENPRSWRKVYERYAKEEAEAEAHALAQLGATFAGLNKLKQENRTNIADPRLLPRIGRMGSGMRSRGRGFGSGTVNLTFGGGARTKNVVQKARKEAMEVAARKKLSTPILKPRQNLVKVQTAPESMRNEYRIKRQPSLLSQSAAKTGIKRPREEDDERAQRESRLLAAKKPKVQPNVLRDEELEDSGATTSRPASAATSRPGAPSKANKSMGLFSRSHNSSHQQTKVIKTVGQPVSRASPEKSSNALKARPGHPAEFAKKHSSSRLTSTSPPSQSSSRSHASRINTTTSRVSSPGSEDSRPGKIATGRSSRSPSVTSSLFGSPEPGSPAPNRRGSSFQSSDGRSPSPPPTKRPGAREAAKVQQPRQQPGEAKAGTHSRRDVEDPDVAGTSSAATTTSGSGGGAAAQPLRKKKKVDIFMRPKKATPR